MVHLNLTYLHCLQHSFFEHLLNLYCDNLQKNTDTQTALKLWKIQYSDKSEYIFAL